MWRDIRSVTGGEYAGGFFGLADVLPEWLKLLVMGNTSISGSADSDPGQYRVRWTHFGLIFMTPSVSGASVDAAGLEGAGKRQQKNWKYVNDPVYTGAAGGFGGALLNGSVKGSKVTNLRKVNGMNYEWISEKKFCHDSLRNVKGQNYTGRIYWTILERAA